MIERIRSAVTAIVVSTVVFLSGESSADEPIRYLDAIFPSVTKTVETGRLWKPESRRTQG